MEEKDICSPLQLEWLRLTFLSVPSFPFLRLYGKKPRVMDSKTALEIQDPQHPRVLIPELCRLFYSLGWATGTGGGVSIKHGGHYYVAPSGVQKEKIQPQDLFVLDADGETIIEGPRCSTGVSLKQSECTPLFFNAFTMRSAGCCLHTHSQNAVLVTMFCEKEFRITQVEMIKGIRKGTTGEALNFYDTLVVPIIDNTAFEKDLTSSMAEAMKAYPDTHCVLVRRHGCYIWGETWQRAKAMAECYDYLFELAVKMRQLGIPLEKASP